MLDHVVADGLTPGKAVGLAPCGVPSTKRGFSPAQRQLQDPDLTMAEVAHALHISAMLTGLSTETRRQCIVVAA